MHETPSDEITLYIIWSTRVLGAKVTFAIIYTIYIYVGYNNKFTYTSTMLHTYDVIINIGTIDREKKGFHCTAVRTDNTLIK